MFLEAEALDFVKVLASLIRDDVVRCYADYWRRLQIFGLVKCQSGFARSNYNAILTRIKFPQDIRLRNKVYNKFLIVTVTRWSWMIKNLRDRFV